MGKLEGASHLFAEALLQAASAEVCTEELELILVRTQAIN